MDLESYNKIVVDTSIFLLICERQIDLFEIEKYVINPKYFVTESVLYELEKQKEKSLKIKKCFNILKIILNKFEVIEDNYKYGDKSLLSLDNSFIFLTNDTELIKKLKSQGKVVYRVNKKNSFVKL